MTSDSCVMNVSMASGAADLGACITGIATAITLYTLFMGSTMITGAKVKTFLGRRRAVSFFTGRIPTMVPGAAKAKTAGNPSDNRGSERVLAWQGDAEGECVAG
jgi:hypothetical protein